MVLHCLPLTRIGVFMAYLSGILCEDIKNETCKLARPFYPDRGYLKATLDKWRWGDNVDEPYFMENSSNLNLYTDTVWNPTLHQRHLQPLMFSLSRDRKCRNKRGSDKLRQRSNCPWYYMLNYSFLRFPQILITARCKCDKCFGGKGINTKCEPILIQRKVLRIKTDNAGNLSCDDTGTYIFQRSVEDVAIGCTCVFQDQDQSSDTSKNKKMPR